METAILDGNGRPTAYGFACGCLERVGEHVTIAREHGAYIVARHPSAPGGWFREGRRTIGEARLLARAVAYREAWLEAEARLSKQLVTIRCDVPVELDPQQLHVNAPDTAVAITTG